jgi:hypothetical protein
LDEAVKEQGWLRGNVNTYSKRFTTYFDKLLIEDPLAIVVTTVIVALPFFFLCWSQSLVGTEKGRKK